MSVKVLQGHILRAKNHSAEFKAKAIAFYLKLEFNTDQGSQYTSKGHIDILKNHNVQITMNTKT